MFMAIGHTPNTSLFAGAARPRRRRLRAGGRAAHAHQRDGVFAAGDVTDTIYKQAVTAAGQGCKAAIDAERFLEAQAPRRRGECLVTRESPGETERLTARDQRRSQQGEPPTMSNLGTVNDQEFQTSVLDSETPVLVDFWAEWCVPCHMVSPVVEEIGQEKGEGLKVVKLNIDENPQATRTYGVMSIPSLILFKGGQEVARVIGAKPKDAILRDLEPHL